jgi:addiction module HigA family antidote
MIIRKRRPTPPGEILLELYLKPHGIKQTQLAEALGISRKHVSTIVHGRGRLEPEVAVRLGRLTDSSPTFWINLQRAVDVWDAEVKLKNWHPVPLIQKGIESSL